MSLIWIPVLVTVIVCIWILIRPNLSSIRLSVCLKYMVVGGLLVSAAAFFLTMILTVALNSSQLPLMFIYLFPVIFAFGEIAGIIKFFRAKNC